MKLTISGNTPAQKNRKIISVNRATGKPFLRTAPAEKEWRAKAVLELKSQFRGYKVTDYPINVSIVVYFDSKRRRDLDNCVSSIMDAMVEAEIIEDDNTNFVECITVSFGGVDKENPRAEVMLDE